MHASFCICTEALVCGNPQGRAANRVQATTATLYDCFDSKQAFEEAMAFAESIGARAQWSDPVKMAFVVRRASGGRIAAVMVNIAVAHTLESSP